MNYYTVTRKSKDFGRVIANVFFNIARPDNKLRKKVGYKHYSETMVQSHNCGATEMVQCALTILKEIKDDKNILNDTERLDLFEGELEILLVENINFFNKNFAVDKTIKMDILEVKKRKEQWSLKVLDSTSEDI